MPRKKKQGPADVLKWSKASILLAGATVPTGCYRYGALVVVKDASMWAIRHAETGVGVAVKHRRLKSKAAAQRCAEALLPMLDWSQDKQGLMRQTDPSRAVGRAAYEMLMLHVQGRAP